MKLHKKYKKGKAPNYLEWEEIFQLVDMADLVGKENAARDVTLFCDNLLGFYLTEYSKNGLI